MAVIFEIKSKTMIQTNLYGAICHIFIHSNCLKSHITCQLWMEVKTTFHIAQTYLFLNSQRSTIYSFCSSCI